MDQVQNVLGWDVFENVAPESVSAPTLSPQEQMMEAIRAQNVPQLISSLELGANPKVLVGKEKMAVFAVRNFSQEIIKVLQKNGVSFKDFSNIAPAIYETDNVQAFEWMLETKHNKEKDFKIKMLLPDICSAGACNIFNAISEKINHDPESYRSLPSHITASLLSSALTMGNEKTLQILTSIKSGKELQQTLSVFLRSTKCSRLQLQNMHKLLQVSPEMILPLKESIKSVSVSVSYYEILATPGFNALHSKTTHGFNIGGIETLLEFLIYQNNDVVADTFAKNGAEEKIASIVQKRGKPFFSFLAIKASRDLRQSVLKNTRGAWKDWRDENGANALHYLASRTDPPKSLCEDLYVLDAELLCTADASGKTPLMFFPADHAASVTKKMMKKELRSVGVKVATAPQPSKRKM